MKCHVMRTIHSDMVDTLQIMATEISQMNGNYRIWDKGQTGLMLSQTKLAKNSIFVGGVNYTISAMKGLLTSKTQLYDYMKEILCSITINYD